jgi:NAD(P)-dependent dehydrogenase (short-subunit alcohol dehydrogenase family)
MRLKNKVAIITGAGSGQGRAAAMIFSREGAKVVISDWKPELGDEAVTLVKQAGGEAIFVRTDVSESADVQALIRTTVSTFGRIDIIYNNAGVGFSSPLSMSDVINTPEADWDRVIAINLRSMYLTAKYGIPEMIKSGGGSIINTASIAALIGSEAAHAYTAAKGGMVALSRALAVEFGPKNIRVNCICPGAIDTPMIAPVVDPLKKSGQPFMTSPIRRLGTPEDIANCALYLASDESGFVTGATIVVDGGYIAQ